jgi:amino acid transporter
MRRDLAMTAQAASTEQSAGLRRNVLTLPQVVFQGITHIAPSINIVFTFPVIALKAGPDMPISFLLTTIVCVFIANTVSQFSRYMPSSGGYYSFATRGLGARSGFVTTWSYLIYDIIGPAGAIGFLGYLCSTTIQDAGGPDVPWWLIALATFAIVWALTHYGIKLSMRTTAIFGAVEILIMLALAFTFLAKPGHGSSFSAPVNPSLAPHHFGGILAGMVFSVLALSGFEAPAPLAQETKRPGKFIGRAVMLSLLLIGVFYIFTSYASAIGWGTGNMAAFASNANPYYALGHLLWGAGWWFVVIALINSAIGCGLACANAASRVSYTMGQAGTLPARFGKIHPVHRTPTFAIAVQQSIGIVAILIVGLALAPGDIFGFLGTVTTLAVIVLYIMANFALTAYILREHRDDYNVWRHMVLPGIGTLALLPVLFTTVYPRPAWPVDLTPYIFIVAMLAGVGYMIWLERRRPGALQRGATELVGHTTDAAGDVDWDDAAVAGAPDAS